MTIKRKPTPFQLEVNNVLTALIDEHLAPQEGGNGQPAPSPQPRGKPAPDVIATYKPKTFGEIAKNIGKLEHLWENWLVIGSLSMIWSKPKIGKTRLYIGLMKYLWFKLDFPDGATNPWPAGTKTIVIPYDRNHAEIASEMELAGVPDAAAICPHDPSDPAGVSLLSLTDPMMLQILEKILTDNPAAKVIVVDTLTYASEKSLSKPEDMKVILDGVMELAARFKVAVLLLIHENREGEALGRRINERSRVNMRLERYDENDPTRLRLFVKESNFAKRPSLTVVHTDQGVNFEADQNSPSSPLFVAPGKPQKGRPATTSPGVADFLLKYLESGPAPLRQIIQTAQDVGLLKVPTATNPKPSASPLYDAKEWIERMHPDKTVDEFLLTVASGKTLKHWQLIDKATSSASANQGQP
jgi:hypothetical protein